MKKLFLSIGVIIIIVGVVVVISNKEKTTQNTVENIVEMNQEDTLNNQEQEQNVEGEVSYIAQKVFLSKPTDTVVGSTSDVSGSIDYNEGVLNGYVEIPTTNLSTGNNSRDTDVRALLGDKITANIKNVSIVLTGTHSIPVELTINEVTKTVFFVTEVETVTGGISLKGYGNVAMSDFSIKAPNAAGIYSVEDEIILNFDFFIS